MQLTVPPDLERRLVAHASFRKETPEACALRMLDQSLVVVPTRSFDEISAEIRADIEEAQRAVERGEPSDNDLDGEDLQANLDRWRRGPNYQHPAAVNGESR